MRAVFDSGLSGRTTTATSRWWTRPAVIVAVALLLRLCWAALVPIEPVSDSVLYDAFARSIASGHGYAFPEGNPTAYWPVGASAVYAALYALFGVGPWPIALFQVLLGGAIVAMTWRLAALYLGVRVAALAAWLMALWPLMIEFTTIFASELPFIALLLAALNVWASGRPASWGRAVLWGACIAGATYVRPTAWPLLLIFPLIAGILDRRWREAGVTLLVSVLTASMLFAPWIYRNYQLFDRFVLVAANAGPNLWMGNNPASSGGYMPLPEKDFANEVERARYFGREAAHYIEHHPLDYLRLSLRRAVMTYDRETIGVVWNEPGLKERFGASSLPVLKLLSTGYWWPMLLLGLWGAVRLVGLQQATAVWPLLTALAYFGIVPILTVAQDRYHMPINPLLAVFAARAAVAVAARMRRSPSLAADG